MALQQPPKLSIVIPVFNEINTLSEVLRQINKVPHKKEIIIVDDGSSDGTREFLQKLKAKNTTILFNRKNHGKGYSLRKGFQEAKGDIVIVQDADLEYYPDEYPQLIEKIIEGKADVVYGTRFLGSRRVFNFYHYLGNKVLNFIASVLYNTNLSDLMTCYKAFRKKALEKLQLTADGFGIEAQITAQVFKNNLKVYEVPISYNGRDYDEGKKIRWTDFFISVHWLVIEKFMGFNIGMETLQRMRLMKNNNRWIINRLAPFMGKTVLEVGSGIGNLSRLLLKPKRRVILSDISPFYIDRLKQSFIGNPNVKVIHHDIAKSNPKLLAKQNIDTVVMVNVLEHIEKDQKALSNIHRILKPKGKLLVVVPAHQQFYGSLDKLLDHYRRYSKTELIKKLKKAGFKVNDIYFHNLLSALGWFINSRILKARLIGRTQAKLVDKFIPIIARVEYILRPPFGLSLVAIAQKR